MHTDVLPEYTNLSGVYLRKVASNRGANANK